MGKSFLDFVGLLAVVSLEAVEVTLELKYLILGEIFAWYDG